ncbi:MAG: UDP-N-acetylmuramoyl-L-alanyl-D-glutamate--2,6-diaminopimelate ligase [Zoogloeaceae bacterium]|jgi:murE/murF fusion protein|nr:UDP-N-acetylmuramoyl-L-alanyl-D-glutamate--2,6-diaminopimelate ligase [Zoogloeaceae bacterium]
MNATATEMTLDVLLRAFAGLDLTEAADDSRQVRPGALFLAYPQGRSHIPEALGKGAVAVCWEPDDAPGGFVWNPDWRVPNMAVPNLRALAGPLSQHLAGRPGEALAILAVTGTNGKTSVSQWLARSWPEKCAVIGTLGAGFAETLAPTGFTTPEAPLLARRLAELRTEGARAVALEASSIGIAEGRVNGLRVDTAVFTNFTHDHLDYHGSMEAYAAAKEALFRWPNLRLAVLNLDDPFGRALARSTTAHKTIGYSLTGRNDLPAVVRAENPRDTAAGGQAFRLVAPQGAAEVETRLIGRYNLANLLAVAAVLLDRGLKIGDVAARLAILAPPPGRMERHGGENAPLILVDYAHTPDALRNALAALRPIAETRGGRLACLFGCGGCRDRGKRPEMGRIAAECADQVWITSDNPRDEEPGRIIADIAAGAPGAGNIRIEEDRTRAIRQMIWQAAPEDVLLLAGKGHEACQEIAGARHPLRPDGDQAEAALTSRRTNRMRWDLHEIAETLQGRPLGVAGGIFVDGVTTDTRADCGGRLFIALKGARFDAHDYLEQAVARGATALLVDREGPLPARVPAIVVEDTRLALGRLAAAWRGNFAIPLVALTGSNGKTTTREMIVRILVAASGEAAVLATQGNFNNDIGLPLTLLRLAPENRFAVIEAGMNHPGEIAYLTRIARPTVALVTNAGRAHLEGMGDLAAVAREKGSLYAGLPPGGVAILNADDPHVDIWRAELPAGVQPLAFSLRGQGDVVGEARSRGLETRLDIRIPATGREPLTVTLATPGLHNAANALAAAATAWAVLRAASMSAGMVEDCIRRGLEGFAGVRGRLQRLRGPHGATILDDSYNANPDSVRAGIDVLAATAGPRILVLGDMGEIGADSARHHDEIGDYARSMGVDRLCALGEASRRAVRNFGAGGVSFKTPEALAKALCGELRADTTVLVKGSRFMRMERVITALLAEAAGQTERSA